MQGSLESTMSVAGRECMNVSNARNYLYTLSDLAPWPRSLWSLPLLYMMIEDRLLAVGYRTQGYKSSTRGGKLSERRIVV